MNKFRRRTSIVTGGRLSYSQHTNNLKTSKTARDKFEYSLREVLSVKKIEQVHLMTQELKYPPMDGIRKAMEKNIEIAEM